MHDRVAKQPPAGSSSHVVAISEFKAHALRYLEATARTGQELVITKRGIPIARVLPYRKQRKTRLGRLSGLMTIHGDIVGFNTADEWEANA